MRSISTLIMLAALVAPGHGQPPEPRPPQQNATRAKPSAHVAAFEEGDNPPEAVDVEPVPRVEGPTASVAGFIVELSAHGSRNCKGFAWTVMPDVGAKVSADGKVCYFSTPKPGTYTVVLAGSTATGKVAIATAKVTLRVAPESDEEEATAPVGRKPPIATAPVGTDEKQASKVLAEVIKANRDPVAMVKLATGLKLVAAACIQGQIRSVEEFERALEVHTGGLESVKLIREAAIDVVDATAGDNENWQVVHDALHRVADVILSKAK